ncbi:general odorant-binding protein 70 isoform X2 [Phlebotomus papatasi]|uniref:general odorant-binding protein 70 isoform X2 n=1 Tax=Phlebotomus papatasi TaxID=29031 RepID=UPI002484121E|nr:general odorant-binding protein 70 isoform X2 [Phlebotomus papatasi]
MRLRVLILIFVSSAEGFFISFAKKSVNVKCRKLPNVDKNIEEVLSECQEEVKYEFVRELYGYQQYDLAQSPIERLDTLRRSKRDAEEFQHPTTVTHVERRLAGCLLRCFYKRNKALNYFGYPTLYGLVHIYTDGIDDHPYFMAVLQATEECLLGISHKYSIHIQLNIDRESCDVAFDVFDCLSDKITEYCSNQTLPDNHGL